MFEGKRISEKVGHHAAILALIAAIQVLLKRDLCCLTAAVLACKG